MTSNPLHCGAPRRWFLAPLSLGIGLMVLSIMIWYHPQILLFMVVAPLFLAGLGLMLFGLDLWHGAKGWREKVRNVKFRFSVKDDDHADRPDQ